MDVRDPSLTWCVSTVGHTLSTGHFYSIIHSTTLSCGLLRPHIPGGVACVQRGARAPDCLGVNHPQLCDAECVTGLSFPICRMVVIPMSTSQSGGRHGGVQFCAHYQTYSKHSPFFIIVI